MKFIVEDKVKNLGVKILALKIENINNNINSRELEEYKNNKIKSLIDKYKDYDIKTDKIIEGFYNLHQKVNVPRRKNLPASENLIKLLIKREDLIRINNAVDIYNIISVDSKLCLGAHDIDKIKGNVTLKITDGSENFIPLGSEEKKEVGVGEYSFVDDDNDVICWLDIRQVDKTKVTNETKNILYFIIGNEENTYDELKNVADEISNITTKYLGGKATLI
ncbi:MAG: tRNA ligase [Firmicutes bacterium]|jgi:DNA/RNA-binding domain of Phe-tRNA-synthetase-like protein|nr:tRNA ligase [Bacillota bacterium]